MIRLRQTGRTNGRPCVTSQRQDRHLRLNHLGNCMMMNQVTACRTPDLAHVRISGQSVHRRLRESGLRARRKGMTYPSTTP